MTTNGQGVDCWVHVVTQDELVSILPGLALITQHQPGETMDKEEGKKGPTPGGRIYFTGPDGVGDYKPRSGYFTQYIGVGAASPEATGDLSYLWRAAPDVQPPEPRCSHVGEVGWGWQYNQLLNRRTLLSDMQIKKTEFRASLEDRVSQRFQE